MPPTSSSWRQNWFVRGAQSALFHYVSCAPCLAARSRRKLRSESKSHRHKYRKSHSKNKKNEPEPYPGLYQNPGPGETNIGWASEIAAGPRPVLKSRSGSGGSKELIRKDSGLDGSANGSTKDGRYRVEMTTIALPRGVKVRY